MNAPSPAMEQHLQSAHLQAASKAFATYIERACPPDLVAAVGRIDVVGPNFEWAGNGVASVIGAPEGVVLVTASPAAHIIASEMLGPDRVHHNVRAEPIGPGRFHIKFDNAGESAVTVAFTALVGKEDLS